MECIVNGELYRWKMVCGASKQMEEVLRRKHFSFILFPVLANECDERTHNRRDLIFANNLCAFARRHTKRI